ncbi:acyl-CoA dehydrogenase family protein [Nocardioides sp. YIM 152588]|uniref:acyl-CoA dehydrogenase family protein n=1 Tax=Nocardioides sp. YIM 152588 TaxID=3158259 RepID=UPI0032E4BD80
MTETIEDVESFRLRARAWLAENMPRIDPEAAAAEGEDDDADWLRNRELQKKLYAGGFAGICYPKEYGGLGLTGEHQAAFTEEADGYEMPLRLNTPTFSICAPVILDLGTEEQKQKYIRGAISGEIVLVQFLSEPKGGSDLAGVITRAERDGDTWVLNGQKIWSTSAYAGDYALCLARTDWDAPKHRGLTMFIVPIHHEGVTLRRIRMVAGASDFCEEFFDDVVLPADSVVGQVNDGWTVASRQLVYERTAMGGASPYTSGRRLRTPDKNRRTPAELAADLGRADDPVVQDLVGRWRTYDRVQHHLSRRVVQGIAAGTHPGPAASIMRLFHAEASWVERDVAVAIAGSQIVGVGGEQQRPLQMQASEFLMRQGASLGGGSTEMARNLISERVLGMPREYAADRDVPFNEVRQGR